MTTNPIAFSNIPQAVDLIDAEVDPAVRSLLRLVYGELMLKIAAGETPSSRLDLLYMFQTLSGAFQRSPALEAALRGAFAASVDVDWSE